MASDDTISETLVRRMRPRQPLEQVFTKNLDTGVIAEVAPDWVGVSTIGHGTSANSCVYLSMDDGRLISYFQFDTFEIAMDQAWDMTGVEPGEWEVCAFDLTTDDAFAWHDLPAAPETESE